MPQHSIFPSERRVTGVTIKVEELHTPKVTGFNVQVLQTWDNNVTATVFMCTYHGLMVDLLSDLAMEAASAFLYGERGDVKRACESNRKVASAHERKHRHAEPF